MEAERPGKHHVLTWALSILAVFVLYLLSVPFVLVLPHGTGTSPRGGPTGPNETPAWAETYAVPFNWLSGNTPLGWPLATYAQWCIEKTVKYGLF